MQMAGGRAGELWLKSWRAGETESWKAGKLESWRAGELGRQLAGEMKSRVESWRGWEAEAAGWCQWRGELAGRHPCCYLTPPSCVCVLGEEVGGVGGVLGSSPQVSSFASLSLRVLDQSARHHNEEKG
jgi:hypothetical protein